MIFIQIKKKLLKSALGLMYVTKSMRYQQIEAIVLLSQNSVIFYHKFSTLTFVTKAIQRLQKI